jgi:hypothetical protein
MKTFSPIFLLAFAALMHSALLVGGSTDLVIQSDEERLLGECRLRNSFLRLTSEQSPFWCHDDIKGFSDDGMLWLFMLIE